jgi:tRNA A-37 threonylcarbamoyl transferase component Bud32
MSDAEEATVQVGQILGDKYEVTRLIGKGGMGAVVEARHLALGEAVALKILHPRYLDNAEAVARFQQEARAAVQIRGAHSARLIDVGTAPTGAPFLVMELLTGEDLAAVAARGPQPLEPAVDYILQACEGMAEVHAHGIVHRDVKPGNLFLTTAPDGSPLIKVLDFGIAKNVARDPAIGTLTMTLVALGTPLYMAPEQIRSSRTVDARADVWSLGAILYELLTGVAAFGGNTVAHITQQVLEAEPMMMTKIRPDIPHELEAAVLRALAKDVEKRWVDVAAFAAALAPFAADGASSAARTARILSLGIFTSDTPIAATLDAEDAHMPGTGRFDASVLGRRRRSRVLVGAALACAVAVLGIGIAAGAPWEPAAPGRVVAVSGVRNVALQRIGYASMTARLGGAGSTKNISAAAAPLPIAPAAETVPASSATPAPSAPSTAAPAASSAPKKLEPPPPLPPRGPTGKPKPPAPPPRETSAPAAPPPPPGPPPPKFDPLGARK